MKFFVFICIGICVKVWVDGDGNRASCGGFAGTQCPIGHTCFDDESDDCSVTCGGSDCIGICVDPVIVQPLTTITNNNENCEVCTNPLTGECSFYAPCPGIYFYKILASLIDIQ